MKLLLKFIHMIKLSDKQLVAISFSLPPSPSLTLLTMDLFAISKLSIFYF